MFSQDKPHPRFGMKFLEEKGAAYTPVFTIHVFTQSAGSILIWLIIQYLRFCIPCICCVYLLCGTLLNREGLFIWNILMQFIQCSPQYRKSQKSRSTEDVWYTVVFSSTWLETKAEFSELKWHVIYVMKKQYQNTNSMVPEMQTRWQIHVRRIAREGKNECWSL